MQSNGFSENEIGQIREGIREKYQRVSRSANGLFSYKTGRSGAISLGYDQALINQMPESVLESFCGVGNPFSIETIQKGEEVLDIGCGAGFDLYVASTLVGEATVIYGVDLTASMVDKARANLKKLGTSNSIVNEIESEQLPFPAGSFSVVISNGVFNLSPNKPRLFKEIYRILKPGGRLQFADIILEKPLPSHLATSVESWSQ